MAGAGEKALCAGGDVAALAEYNKEGPEGQQRSKDYFGLEYQLDHLIATYSKPYIAYMDGITMGGGVGLSVHAPFRIATERTVFAMPETKIGFFPDVGGGFFLPRLDGYTGRYLALTSETLKGVNVFYAGIGTHYIHSSNLGALTQRLSELDFSDSMAHPERLDLIDATIDEFSSGLPHDEVPELTGNKREAIDRCFRYTTVEEILDALKKEEQNVDGIISQWDHAPKKPDQSQGDLATDDIGIEVAHCRGIPEGAYGCLDIHGAP
jgi:3-hydroxyisobutyryl-CoA hydrolase